MELFTVELVYITTSKVSGVGINKTRCIFTFYLDFN
jgi:hypothetical protein